MSINKHLSKLPVVQFRQGEVLLSQDVSEDCIYFLKQGEVGVIKDNVTVARISEEAAVFGEMAILLNIGHSASVQCLEDSSFYKLDDPETSLAENPELLLHISRSLCHRLFNLNQYLVDMKSKADKESQEQFNSIYKSLEKLIN